MIRGSELHTSLFCEETGILGIFVQYSELYGIRVAFEAYCVVHILLHRTSLIIKTKHILYV